MKKAWHNYFIYISLCFLVYALVRADYLRIPIIYSNTKLLLAFFALFLGFIANAIAQMQLLANYNVFLNIYNALSMVGLTVFGKYIPGKMWMLIGKAAYIAGKSQYSVINLSVLFVRAQLVAIWCGLVLGILGLLLNDAFERLSWIGIATLIMLTLILFSPSVNHWAEKIINRIKKNGIKLAPLNIVSTMKVLPWFLSSWMLWGGGFHLLADGITAHSIPFTTIFCFPLAGTLGIMFLLAPGGVGIREGIIVGYLTLLKFSLSDAVTVAAASRLWFLVGEGFIFLVGMVCDRMMACQPLKGMEKTRKSSP